MVRCERNKDLGYLSRGLLYWRAEGGQTLCKNECLRPWLIVHQRDLGQCAPYPKACEGDDPGYSEYSDDGCDHHVESSEVAIHCSNLSTYLRRWGGFRASRCRRSIISFFLSLRNHRVQRDALQAAAEMSLPGRLLCFALIVRDTLRDADRE